MIVFIIFSIYLILGLVMTYNYRWCFAEMAWPQIIIAALLMTIGGPSFVIVNIISDLLDMIMPEGWDNDDG